VRGSATRCVLADGFGDERRLGAEEAEEGHFVDPGLVGDAAGSRAAEAGFAVDAGRGGEEFLSAGHRTAQSRQAFS
jgi:hypothetical protein